MNMYKFLTILILSIVLFLTNSFSYNYLNADNTNTMRIVNAKKNKLVRNLRLTDKDAEKFIEKYKKWDEKIIEAQINAIEVNNKLKDALKHNASDNMLKTLTSEYVKATENVENSKRNRNKEIKSMLSPRQYAEFVLFDREFTHNLQASIIKTYKAKANKEKSKQCDKSKKLSKKASKTEKKS